MKKSVLYKAAAAVFVAGMGAYYLLPLGESAGEIQYTTATVERGDILNLVVTTGTVKAMGTVEVGSQISGQIADIFVDFNSEVKKGDLLAEIDARTYEGRVKQSEAQLEIAKANVLQQQASLARARADLEEAQRQLDRQQRLGASGHISESEIDRLKTALTSAQAQVTISQAQVSNAKASVIQAEASLFQANIDLERCTIRSPVDGIVINRAIEVGQTVAASMSAPILFTLAQDMRKMQVEASVDEADIGKVKPGQQTAFYVDAFPEKRFEGRVEQVRKAANQEQNVVTYTVIINADNPDNSLLPGMTATVEMTTGQKDNVVRVPNTALRFKPVESSQAQSDPRMAFMETRIQTMKQQLSLTEDQEKAIRTIFEEAMENMPRPGGGPPAGGFSGPPPEGPRRSFFNEEELQAVLNEQQYQEFRRLAREGRGARRQFSGERPEPGEVWVMNAGGQLERQPVLIGLRGDEYTEVMNADHLEGARVAVRATRRQPQ